MSRFYFFLSRGTSLGLVWLAAVASIQAAQPSPSSPAQQVYPSSQEMYQDLVSLLKMIQESYALPLSNDTFFESVLGFLTQLDPHSSYLDAGSYRELLQQTHGSFAGVGLELTMKDGVIFIIAALDDTPAGLAGLRTGDLIVAIDGAPVLGLTLTKAVEKLRGDPGTKVVVTIKRPENDLFNVTLVRQKINIRSVKGRMISLKNHPSTPLAYVRINIFDEKTTSQLKEVLEELSNHHPQGLVLDLRSNPGGLLKEVITICNLFLPPNKLIVKAKGQNQNEALYTHAEPVNAKVAWTQRIPIGILINEGSASASEILASALRFHRKNTLILGKTSFGKGSIQTLIPFPKTGGALKLTTALYSTASGVQIQGKGIVPDVFIDQRPAYIPSEKSSPLLPLKEKDYHNALSSPEPASKTPSSSSLPLNTERPHSKVTLDPPLADEQLNEALRIVLALSLEKS